MACFVDDTFYLQLLTISGRGENPNDIKCWYACIDHQINHHHCTKIECFDSAWFQSCKRWEMRILTIDQSGLAMQQCKSSKTIVRLPFSPANEGTTVYPQLVQDFVHFTPSHVEQFPTPSAKKTNLISFLYLHLRQGELSEGFADVAAKQWLSQQHWIDWHVSYVRYWRCKPLIVLSLRVKAYPQTCKPQNRGMTLYDCLRRGA